MHLCRADWIFPVSLKCKSKFYYSGHAMDLWSSNKAVSLRSTDSLVLCDLDTSTVLQESTGSDRVEGTDGVFPPFC